MPDPAGGRAQVLQAASAPLNGQEGGPRAAAVPRARGKARVLVRQTKQQVWLHGENVCCFG